MTHRTLAGSSKPRAWSGPQGAHQFRPTAKMWAVAIPPAERIRAVCPKDGIVIDWAGSGTGGVWLLAGTDTQHVCPA